MKICLKKGPSRKGTIPFSLLVFLALSFIPIYAAEEEPASPIQVRFEMMLPKLPPEASFIHLVVERKPELLSVQTTQERKLELFLRLPRGIRLESPGWKTVTASPKEKKDPTGTWTLYERSEPIPPSESEPLLLARVPITLAVIEEGTNWVITTRARLIEPGKAWTAFGALFATRQGSQVQFHATPKLPNERNAQENRS